MKFTAPFCSKASLSTLKLRWTEVEVLLGNSLTDVNAVFFFVGHTHIGHAHVHIMSRLAKVLFDSLECKYVTCGPCNYSLLTEEGSDTGMPTYIHKRCSTARAVGGSGTNKRHDCMWFSLKSMKLHKTLVGFRVRSWTNKFDMCRVVGCLFMETFLVIRGHHLCPFTSIMSIDIAITVDSYRHLCHSTYIYSILQSFMSI